MKHILGIVGSKAFNLSEGREDYMTKLEVSDDIIEWLESHDIEIDEFGGKVYICNKVKYAYLGPKIYMVDISLLTKEQFDGIKE